MTIDARIHLDRCPVCDTQAGADRLALVDHFSLERFQLATCPGCGAAFLADPPSPDRIGGYYDNPLGEVMHHLPGGLFNRLRRVLLHQELKRLLAVLPAEGHVVDYGTGDGSVAAYVAAQRRPALGLDLFPPEAWQHPNIPYRQVDLNGGRIRAVDLQLDGAPPAGIIIRHVLEHLYEPRQVLSTFAKAGADHVLVVVPNLGSPWRKILGQAWCFWDPPRHLIHFTPASLRRLAQECGYRVASLETYGIDEWVSSAFRALMLRRKPGSGIPGPLWALAPKSPLAALSSAANALPGNCVIRARLERVP